MLYIVNLNKFRLFLNFKVYKIIHSAPNKPKNILTSNRAHLVVTLLPKHFLLCTYVTLLSIPQTMDQCQ